MFEVTDDGNLIYQSFTGSGNETVSPDGNLFGVDSTPTPTPEDGLLEAPLPSETHASLETDTDIDVDPDPTVSDALTGSGNQVVLPAAGDFTLSTSGDVYIYPEVVSDAPDARSFTSANVSGLPNTTSLAYLEDVAKGYPSHYKYMAFKTDASYSQSMVLWIAPQGVKNQSQNRIDFTDVDCIQVQYIRSGSTNYYQYVKSHYDNYQIPYNSDVFLYTNVVDGYAQFAEYERVPVKSILFFVFMLVVGFLIFFKGGGKN